MKPAEALRSLLILPRSPSPALLEARPIEELKPEELRELVLRQKVELPPFLVHF